MTNKVDILIPSKDRACQLHLLLSQISKNLKGIGRITITIQSSSDDFAKGYSLLKQRVASDDIFRNLRDNAEIVYHERDSLAGVFDSLTYLGDSKYILPLTDDEIFHKKYDLENAPASQYFFNNPSVLACAIRLGKNITPKVPESHRKALYVRGQPNFHNGEENIRLWSWPDNLHTYHWACIASVTGHIYRKDVYLEWFHKFGKDSFLEMEGRVVKYLLEKLFGLPKFFTKVLFTVDLIQMRFLKKIFGINEQDVLSQIFYKFLYHLPMVTRKGIPVMMVSPLESVTTCLDINSNQDWRGVYNKKHAEQHLIPVASNSILNQKYLKGEIISTDFIDESILDEPMIRDPGRMGKMGALNYISY